MKVLFLSSEVTPFSRTGGLGDVAGSLPKALKNLGHEVRVITPCYRAIRERRYGLRDIARLRSVEIKIGEDGYQCAVKSGFIPGSKVQTYFIHNTELYHRRGLYADPQTNQDYPDNCFRFAFFNHSALQLMMELQWIPEIIHCNDWQTGLVPYLIRHIESYQEMFAPSRTVMHLHNVAFQGLFPLESVADIGVNADDARPGGPLEFYGKLSFLKAGIVSADILVTVSPTYSREITTGAEFGYGMEGIFARRWDMLFGVLNGVESDIWNPATDSHIPRQYTVDDFVDGKAANKAALQEQFRLPIDPDIPLIGMISRLADQKGFDLLADVEEELLKLPVQFIILGVGDERYETMLQKWAERYPDKVVAVPKFSNDLANLIEAGADIFLMPSKFEPCGLNQMYSLLYGTVPVVRRTGGLTDTVEPYNTEDGTGNGFVFDEYDGKVMLNTLKNAIDLYDNKPVWHMLQKQGMESDFSWERSAEQVNKLYRDVLSRPAYINDV